MNGTWKGDIDMNWKLQVGSLFRGIDHGLQRWDNLVAKPFLFLGNLDKNIFLKKHENEAKIKLETQCHRQWLYRAPLWITLKIKIWVVVDLEFMIFFPSIKKLYLM